MRAKVWIALGTIYVVWGSTFLAIAVVVRDLPPFLSMSLRHLVAGSLLFGWVLVRHRNRDPIGWRAVAGGVRLRRRTLPRSVTVVLAWAQQDVPSGIAALLVGTIPLWFAILAWIFMGERLGGRALAGLVLGFAGLALLVDPSGEEGAEPIGALAIVVGALAWSAGSIYSQRSALPKDTLLAAAMGMLAGGALLAVVSGLAGEWNDATFTPDALCAIAYMVVVGSLIGFSAYVWLLKIAPGVDGLDLRVRQPGDRRPARLGLQRRGDHGPDAPRRRRDRRRRRAHGEPEHGEATGVVASPSRARLSSARG